MSDVISGDTLSKRAWLKLQKALIITCIEWFLKKFILRNQNFHQKHVLKTTITKNWQKKKKKNIFDFIDVLTKSDFGLVSLNLVQSDTNITCLKWF